MKKFWKKTEGFTLVELIVVIAILGILAGVGTVAYSGYIKKANMAADQVLLDSLNTAFAAACIENGVPATEVDAEDISLTDKTVNDADIVLTHAKAADIKADLLGYYDEDAEFKVMTKLEYHKDKGMFEGTEGEGTGNNFFAQIFAGVDIDDSAEAVKLSTFGTIGAEGLMIKLDTVTGLAAGLAERSSAFGLVLEANIPGMAQKMGFTLGADGQPGDDFWAELGEMAAKKAAENNPGEEITTEMRNEAMNQILSNYAVLQAAQSTTGTTSELLADLQRGGSLSEVKALMSNSTDVESTQAGLTKAAMMYAMYTAYANGMEDTDPNKAVALENAASVDKFLIAMSNAQTNPETDDFMNYLNDSESTAAKDLEGYLGALDIINKGANNNPEAVSKLLYNGYNNAELISALNGLLS